MTIVLIPVLLVVGIAIIALLALRAWGRRSIAVEDELAGPAPTLDYVTPPGQDPALLKARLQEDGYQAASDPGRTDLIHISCPAGVDRERPRVRAAIASVQSTVLDSGAPLDPTPVRFEDES